MYRPSIIIPQRDPPQNHLPRGGPRAQRPWVMAGAPMDEAPHLLACGDVVTANAYVLVACCSEDGMRLAKLA